MYIDNKSLQCCVSTAHVYVHVPNISLCRFTSWRITYTSPIMPGVKKIRKRKDEDTRREVKEEER